MNIIKTLLGTIALGAITATTGFAQDVQNDRFKEVLDRGVLRVGVQGAFKPWAFRAPDGDRKSVV